MRRVAALAFVVLSTGCTPTGITQDFSRFSRCPEKEIEVIDGDHDSGFRGEAYKASGCGITADYVCRNLSCESPQIIVVKRHAAMYGCNVANVHVDRIAGAAWRTSGCNQQAIFNCFEEYDVPIRCLTDAEANASRSNRQ